MTTFIEAMAGLQAVSKAKLSAVLIVGRVFRCYLYPGNIDPDVNAEAWIGYGDSRVGLSEAVLRALDIAQDSLTREGRLKPEDNNELAMRHPALAVVNETLREWTPTPAEMVKARAQVIVRELLNAGLLT